MHHIINTAFDTPLIYNSRHQYTASHILATTLIRCYHSPLTAFMHCS
ncbi:hypothetical protein CsSME_00051422 [Camellia sinensis var. sinensis]